MKRSQRTVHAYIWPALALIMAATVVLALLVREHPATSAATHAPVLEMH